MTFKDVVFDHYQKRVESLIVQNVQQHVSNVLSMINNIIVNEINSCASRGEDVQSLVRVHATIFSQFSPKSEDDQSVNLISESESESEDTNHTSDKEKTSKVFNLFSNSNQKSDKE